MCAPATCLCVRRLRAPLLGHTVVPQPLGCRWGWRWLSQFHLLHSLVSTGWLSCVGGIFRDVQRLVGASQRRSLSLGGGQGQSQRELVVFSRQTIHVLIGGGMVQTTVTQQ